MIEHIVGLQPITKFVDRVVPAVSNTQCRASYVRAGAPKFLSRRFILSSPWKVSALGARERTVVNRLENVTSHPLPLVSAGAPLSRSFRTRLRMTSSDRVMPNYRVVTVEKPPFVMYDPDKQEWSGYCLDLMTYLSGMLEFTYDIELTPDGKFGTMYENGTWDGMMRELQNKDADIALGALTISSERQTVVDFTIPFYDAVGISMLMKKKKVKTTFFLLAKILSLRMWLSLVGFLIATGICLWLYDRWSPYSHRNDPGEAEGVNKQNKDRNRSLGTSLWYTFFTGTPQGSHPAPKNFSSLMVASIWFLYAFVIFTCFTTFLAASLTLSRIHVPLESFEDFTRQWNYEFAPIKPSEAHTYFERMSHIESRFFDAWKIAALDRRLSEIEEASFFVYEYPIDEKYTRWLRRMGKTGFPATLEEAFRRVNNSQFALIGDATDIKYITYTHCEFLMVGEEFSRRPYGIAVQKDSALKNQLDAALLQLSKDGILEKLKELWWNEKINRPKCPREYKVIDGMVIGDMGGVFVILAVGICLAIGTLSSEFWWFRCWLLRKDSRKNGKMQRVKRVLVKKRRDTSVPQISAVQEY